VPIQPDVPYTTFDAIDLRLGRVIDCVESRSKKPTWKLTIDFGPEIGTRVSCAGIRNYTPEELLGRQVICVMNLGERKMGPEVSQVLTLGVPNEAGETIILTPERPVKEGVRVF
jgi:tRNA-binding protein